MILSGILTSASVFARLLFEYIHHHHHFNISVLRGVTEKNAINNEIERQP